MRNLLIGMLATIVAIGATAMLASAQPVAPPPPDAFITSDSFVNNFSSKLGLSADVARSALQQAVATMPGQAGGGPEVRVMGAPGNGAGVVTNASAGAGALTSMPAGPGAAGGPVTSVDIGDELVSSVASSLSLDTDTVRKALLETFRDINPELLPSPPPGG